MMIVEESHKLGLKVHPYTFRNESIYYDNSLFNSMEEEIDYFLNIIHVDGIFSDHPDIAMRSKYRYLNIHNSDDSDNKCTIYNNHYNNNNYVTITLLVLVLITLSGLLIMVYRLYRLYKSKYQFIKNDRLDM